VILEKCLPLIVTLTADDLLRNGPVIQIEISNPVDSLKKATVNGLIDTGAAFSAINPQLAQSCHFDPTRAEKNSCTWEYPAGGCKGIP
jgi:hypothetical protein